MSQPMTKTVADVHAAVTERRERIREVQNDTKLTRPSAEAAVDLADALYITSVMDIQNRALADLIADSLLASMGTLIQMIAQDVTSQAEREASSVTTEADTDAS